MISCGYFRAKKTAQIPLIHDSGLRTLGLSSSISKWRLIHLPLTKAQRTLLAGMRLCWRQRRILGHYSKNLPHNVNGGDYGISFM
ncbi:hypothetical protein CEXT_2601 [Caerostris extrusa]|uniref:Uncharacterized protein n=1 Tax=Caerostris extrusa TaxID=172846 RepID=A0AAV4R657_CAEEX|nr:hypothetical protein CEXT_2601 [Caerostris extrusa]